MNWFLFSFVGFLLVYEFLIGFQWMVIGGQIMSFTGGNKKIIGVNK
jgi:hypothetical protein